MAQWTGDKTHAMPPQPTVAELMWNPDVRPLWAAVFFAFGLLWGSFFNVAIYRMPMGMSVNRPKRSFCFRCGTMIGALENIPVLSWLLQRGRCRHCGARVSPRYAVVELLTAFVFLGLFLTANPPGAAAFSFATLWYCAFAGLLIIGTFTDFDHWIIPDEVTIGGTIAGLVASLAIGLLDGASVLTHSGPFPALRTVWGGPWFGYVEALIPGGTPWADRIEPYWWEGTANSILGAIFGPALLLGVGKMGKLLFRKDAMGFGDVKLFGAIGATLGPINCLVVLMISAMFGTAAGLCSGILSRVFADKNPPLRAGLQLPPPDLPEDAPARPLETFLAKMDKASYGGMQRHLPYGPWIALAALIVLMFSAQVRDGIAVILAP